VSENKLRTRKKASTSYDTAKSDAVTQ